MIRNCNNDFLLGQTCTVGDDDFMSQHVINGNGSGHLEQQQHVRGTGQQQHRQQQQRLILSNDVCLSDHKPDAGSPLLSISEVTNTLLNQ